MAADYLDWYRPVIEVTRGRIVESIHFGAAAVVDSQGKLLASIGNSGAVSFLRSSSKPFQALPFIEMGGAEKFDFSSAEIGLICASHSGTDEHFDALTRLQSRIGITEADLMCGTHPPMHKPTADTLLLKGEKPTQNRHNCSGKHTGMLAYARLLGVPITTYLDLASPVQQNILRAFSEMCEIPVEKVELGIDGCSAPTFAVPLYNAALGLARLSDPHGLGEVRETACRKIFNGMTGSPMMVAGPDRFDTLFMTVLKGRILTKAGAEGYQVFGIPPRGIQPGIGIALKISDGDLNDRARDLMGVEILRQMGLISADEIAALSSVFIKKLTNWRKIEIGEIRPCFRLNNPD